MIRRSSRDCSLVPRTSKPQITPTEYSDSLLASVFRSDSRSREEAQGILAEENHGGGEAPAMVFSYIADY